LLLALLQQKQEVEEEIRAMQQPAGVLALLGGM